jgi:hypothetical protein
VAIFGYGQTATDSAGNSSPNKGKLLLEGYVDVYYSYALSHPKDKVRPYFVSFNRDNEFNINLAYMSLKYNSDRVRATFTPGFGTYMNANYSPEPQTLQHILEANVGVRLFRKRDIWLDAGVMNSPYGNESTYSFDQIPYTRSIGAENSPYYLTGARLTVPFDSKWTVYLFLVNGWQVIQGQHDGLDFGSQLEFKPTDKWDINWNTYIGNETTPTNPDYGTRFFTDFYATYTPSEKLSLTADTYSGWQQVNATGKQVTRQWWNAALSSRITFAPGNSFSLRVEHFSDPDQVLVTPVTGVNGFVLSSVSLGYNLSITDEVLFRLEARYFKSPSDIYPLRNQTTTSQDLWLTAGLTARFR